MHQVVWSCTWYEKNAGQRLLSSFYFRNILDKGREASFSFEHDAAICWPVQMVSTHGLAVTATFHLNLSPPLSDSQCTRKVGRMR